MKLQVEEALKAEGKQFPFSFQKPAAELGDVDAFPWKSHDVAVEGTFWFDGNHLVVQGTVHTTGMYSCSRCLTRYRWIGMQHCLKSMVRKQSFRRYTAL